MNKAKILLQLIESSYMDDTSPSLGVWDRELPIKIKRTSQDEFQFFYKKHMIGSMHPVHVPDSARTLQISDFSGMKIGSAKSTKVNSKRLSYLLGGGRSFRSAILIKA